MKQEVPAIYVGNVQNFLPVYMSNKFRGEVIVTFFNETEVLELTEENDWELSSIVEKGEKSVIKTFRSDNTGKVFIYDNRTKTVQTIKLAWDNAVQQWIVQN